MLKYTVDGISPGADFGLAMVQMVSAEGVLSRQDSQLVFREGLRQIATGSVFKTKPIVETVDGVHLLCEGRDILALGDPVSKAISILRLRPENASAPRQFLVSSEIEPQGHDLEVMADNGEITGLRLSHRILSMPVSSDGVVTEEGVSFASRSVKFAEIADVRTLAGENTLGIVTKDGREIKVPVKTDSSRAVLTEWRYYLLRMSHGEV